MSDTRQQIAEQHIARAGLSGTTEQGRVAQIAVACHIESAMSSYAAAVLEDEARKWHSYGDGDVAKWLRARAAQERER